MPDPELNIELILALAEGSLAPDDAAAAEASLSTDEREELAAQRVAMAALADAPTVRLTDEERAGLRASVRAEIHLPEAASVADTRSPAPKTPWYARYLPAFGAAAAAVVVVAIGVNLAGGGGADESADSAGHEATTAHTAAATTEAASSDMMATDAAQATEFAAAVAEEAESAGEAADDDGAAADGGAESAPSTTTAAQDRGLSPLPHLGLFSSSMTSAEVADAIVDHFDGVPGMPLNVDRFETAAASTELQCWKTAQEAVEDGLAVVGMGFATFDGDDAEAYGFDIGDDIVGVVVVTEGCRLATLPN